PPTSGDALAYHLTAPKLWLHSHRMWAIWWNWPTFQPLGVEMHFAYAQALWNGAAAVVVGALLASLGTVAVYGRAREVPLGGDRRVHRPAAVGARRARRLERRRLRPAARSGRPRLGGPRCRPRREHENPRAARARARSVRLRGAHRAAPRGRAVRRGGRGCDPVVPARARADRQPVLS